MEHTTWYHSPIGWLLLEGDEEGLTALRFCEVPDPPTRGSFPALEETRRWLDRYFAGQVPEVLPPLHSTGTPFQLAVWALLGEIPYGETVTYGALARALSRQRNGRPMSAQAVGGALNRNRLPILLPCHRVVGSGGSLTGYGGGLPRKLALLKLEGVDLRRVTLPDGSPAGR